MLRKLSIAIVASAASLLLAGGIANAADESCIPASGDECGSASQLAPAVGAPAAASESTGAEGLKANLPEESVGAAGTGAAGGEVQEVITPGMKSDYPFSTPMDD